MKNVTTYIVLKIRNICAKDERKCSARHFAQKSGAEFCIFCPLTTALVYALGGLCLVSLNV